MEKNLIEISTLAEYIGIASSALSGFYVANRKKCDWLGILVASFLTALGGGLMRDALCSRPPYALTENMPWIIVIVVLFLSIIFKVHKKSNWENKFWFIFADAIGVVSYTLAGTIIALQRGDFTIFGVICMGVFTGVGGGALRDIVLNEIPWFLRTGLYATVAILVAFFYYVGEKLGFGGFILFWLVFAFGIILRMVAYYKNWHLPVL